MRLEEGVLVLAAQRHDRTHVHLVVGGQHGGGLLSLHQALGDGLTQAAHRHALLGTLAFDRRGGSGLGCRGGRFGGLLRRTVLDRLLNVFLQNATAFAGTFDLAHVEIVFRNELACSRRQNLAIDLGIFFTIGGRRLVLVTGGLSGSAAITSAICTFGEGRQQSLGLDDFAFLNLDFGKRAVSRSDHFQHDLVGLDFGQHLVTLDRFADFLVPAGDGAFLHGFREARRLDVKALAGGSGLGSRLLFTARLLLTA